MLTIYHNPRCRKSRETLALIHDNAKSCNIVEYLLEPLDAEEMKDILKKLDIPAEKLLRKNEKLYKAEFKGKSFTEDEWIDIMIKNPILIERPIVLNEEKAIIGRPPENVLPLLN